MCTISSVHCVVYSLPVERLDLLLRAVRCVLRLLLRGVVTEWLVAGHVLQEEAPSRRRHRRELSEGRRQAATGKWVSSVLRAYRRLHGASDPAVVCEVNYRDPTVAIVIL